MALLSAIFQVVGTILLCMELLKMMVMFRATADASWEQNLGNLSCPDPVLDMIEEIAFWTRLDESSSIIAAWWNYWLSGKLLTTADVEYHTDQSREFCF